MTTIRLRLPTLNRSALLSVTLGTHGLRFRQIVVWHTVNGQFVFQPRPFSQAAPSACGTPWAYLIDARPQSLRLGRCLQQRSSSHCAEDKEKAECALALTYVVEGMDCLGNDDRAF